MGAGPTVTVLTGAGVSTDSGIPDFRGPQGIWTRNPEAARLQDIRAYVSDPALRAQSWRNRAEHPAWSAQPGPPHRALARLEREGNLVALATQNIDGLHQLAGSTRVLELHGTLRQTRCLDCDNLRPMPETLDRVRAGEADPPCLVCGGMLKSATISFGQQLDPVVVDRAWSAAGACEVFLAAGTSLGVQPAASLCQVAVDAGARLIVANGSPTPYDDLALASGGLLVRQPLSEALPALVGELLGDRAGVA